MLSRTDILEPWEANRREIIAFGARLDARHESMMVAIGHAQQDLHGVIDRHTATLSAEIAASQSLRQLMREVLPVALTMTLLPLSAVAITLIAPGFPS